MPGPVSTPRNAARRSGAPMAALAVGALAIACGSAIAAEDTPEAAVAYLHQASGSGVHGVVRFEPADEGLRVIADVSGLPEGRHAYHVHLYGDCSATDATSAGTHFNFQGSSKDLPDDIDRITGNLGELVAKGNGPTRHQATVERARLSGPHSILGRAVVVHERGNDPDQPPIGAAGGRIACGVIGATAPTDGSDGSG